MDGKTLALEFAKIGLPILGACLPFPGGAAIGSALAAAIGSPSGKPEDILATLTTSAEALAQGKQFELTHQETMLRISVDAEIKMAESAAVQVQAVNQTLQTEAMGGSWLQKNHHAIESLMASSSVIAIYFVLPLLHEAVPVVPETAWMMLAAILGVTAWQRGAASVATAGKAS
jgi:hypothetical protein